MVIIKPHGFDATYMLLYSNGKKQFKGRIGQFELNHTPPKSAYQYTPFIDINPDLMPVILMTYGGHRTYPSTGNGID